MACPDLCGQSRSRWRTGNVMSAEEHLTKQAGGEDVFPEVSLRLRSR